MKFAYVVNVEDIEHIIVATQDGGGLGMYAEDESEVKANLRDIQKFGFFADRGHMETNETYKQIIPVFVLVDPESNSLLMYQRKLTHTEGRLSGKWTPAFGGHIDPKDAESPNFKGDFDTVDGLTIPPIISAGIARELEEETNLDFDDVPMTFEGFIYDPSDAVGRVHLGVLFIAYVSLTDEVIQKIVDAPEIHDVLLVHETAIPDLLIEDSTKNHGGNSIELEGWAKIILNSFMPEDHE